MVKSAAETRLVLDSSSFVPVPRELADILLLAFSLLELVTALSQYLCVNTYMFDFRCKMCNSNTFFHYLCIDLMEKHDFYCSVVP